MGKATYKAASGQLEGYLNVYQAIDFTNMGADKLTITGTDSSSVKYADMKPCNTTSMKDEADPTKACTIYSIASATVESDGWSGTYSFPLSYNFGSWSQASATGEPVPSHAGTKTVLIRGVRPIAENTKWIGDNVKAIYIQYSFDISGVEAALGSNAGYPSTGKYMVYDPTVTTGVKANSGGSGTGGSGSTSAGRLACQPAVAFFTMLVLAAFGTFVLASSRWFSRCSVSSF